MFDFFLTCHQWMGMMSGVISHAVLPGISLAFFWEINLAIGAFIAGVLSALVVMVIQKRSRIKVDAAMALTLTSFLALGVILITTLETNQINLDEILFGDILGVTSGDVWRTIIITGIITGMYSSYYFDLPSGAAIIMIIFTFFLLAFLFSPSQGLLTEPEFKSKISNKISNWFRIRKQ